MFKHAVLLPLFMVNACAVGPDYKQPDIAIKAKPSFVITAAGTTTAKEPLPDNWWQLYNDPVLNGLVEQAFRANTDLRVSAANLDKAQAIFKERTNAYFPSTQLSAGGTWGDSTMANANGSALSEQQLTRYGGLVMSWEVDLAGRVRRTVESAKADAQAQEAARDAVRVSVAAETVQQYTSACALSVLLNDTRESIRIAHESFLLTQSQAAVGAASQFDVERSSSLLASAEARLPPLNARRTGALLSLAAVMGMPPGEIPPKAVQCAHLPQLAAAVPVGDGTSLIRRRPDIRQAERVLAADTARVGVATADLYPRIVLGGSFNVLRNTELGTNDAFSFGIGPLLTWNFPNSGVARARIAQSEAGMRASLASFDGVILNALKETELALARLDSETRRNKTLQRAMKNTDKAWEIASIRFNNGNISGMEMLDSSRERIDVRNTLSESDLALAEARVDLFKALGGGWKQKLEVSYP